MDPIKSNRAKTGVFNTEVSFQIVQFEFDLKRNSSGRTWIHEYTTPPLHFKGWTGFCGTLSLLSKCYTCFQMNEQCIHRPNSELESKWVVGIQKMVKVWTLFQNCFQSKILLRYLGKTKALIGGGGARIHISMFCPSNFFWNLVDFKRNSLNRTPMHE